MTPRFDAYRYGIQWRPTPRQSNLLMISGYLSVKTLKRAIRSYEQMQQPKYVVGLGSCTINGGMYWDSYNTIKRLDDYLPVDLYIAGCMPRPEALLAGFDGTEEDHQGRQGRRRQQVRREFCPVQGQPEGRDQGLGHAGLQLVSTMKDLLDRLGKRYRLEPPEFRRDDLTFVTVPATNCARSSPSCATWRASPIWCC